MTKPNFNYDPKKLPRELKKYYLSASREDLELMLKKIGVDTLSNLFDHVPDNVKYKKPSNFPKRLEYEELAEHLFQLSEKNRIKTSFIGDGLQHYKVPEIVPYVLSLRGLTTAYTPYQPERSQGTLQTLWIYQSVMSMLTGFEAINASFYERSTCLYEAMNCSLRLKRKTDSVILCDSIYPGDVQTLKTLAKHTKINIVKAPLNNETGIIDLNALENLCNELGDRLASIAFPQVNSLGNLEPVNQLTDLASKFKIHSIAIIDPMLLATKGLLPPSEYGSSNQGANMIVGEGQHLCLGPNYGGPGLGIFGIRYNQKNKNDIRQTAGRYVGKGKDVSGRDCKVMVLSTREQHIRRERATSNICSNQSFIASIAGAGILGRGEKGMTSAILKARDNALKVANEITKLEGLELAFPETPFFNEFVIKTLVDTSKLFEEAQTANLNIGVDVSNRIASVKNNLLKISLFDIHSDKELNELITFFKNQFKSQSTSKKIPKIPPELLRQKDVDLPNIPLKNLKEYYLALNNQNVSPDDNIYPLGSCTMKYNPYINDYAADLEGFSNLHPQAPVQDAQGSLEILYNIQNMFKEITGLPGITTHPVAGAQGELAGIKMFQAYHKDNGENRDLIIIPKTAHGTNPATAVMSGIDPENILLLDANETGEIDFPKFETMVKEHGKRIIGIMVTNPNTSGILEIKFKEMADLIHAVGGLVYMDGANMNAIAYKIDLNALGVDAVHNNLHKTWSIPHGGGGPGDAVVCVSEKLLDFVPGPIVVKSDNGFTITEAKKSIGSFHRHLGNFGHKIRCYTYLRALGREGIEKMAEVAVLSARYLFNVTENEYPTLPCNTDNNPRMHEFILTLSDEEFEKIAQAGTPKNLAIAQIGKLFLDFGLHAPTIAFPELLGLMVEPTESFSKAELDRFYDVIKCIDQIINETPEILKTVPHFTPIDKVDEVSANRTPILSEKITDKLDQVIPNRLSPELLSNLSVDDIYKKIIEEHKKRS